ncbi:MAG: hypothetical protein KKB30_11800 [Proteobacteria bacterium]|nr:hypothetical protein [Pseudomonadota bacterium]MBU1714397.1 hypothetical protein [Pseudomonadota bacterium]
MDFTTNHKIMVEGSDFTTCRQKVQKFFDRNILVKYDTIEIKEEESLSAGSPSFMVMVDQGMEKNRKLINEFMKELKDCGINTLDELSAMDQGYESKTLHTICHLLDGFFGIDSAFYNLTEDSHWLSARLRKKINSGASGYWLLTVKASASSNPDLIPTLRSAANQP